jgi:protein SCO1/2
LKRLLWPLALALLILAAVAIPAFYRGSRAASFHGTTYEPALAAPDFSLVEHTGRAVGLQDFRGKAVLLFFGYTRCPDVCPLTLSRLTQALDSVGAGPDDARVLLVTIDPEHDDMETLATYVSRFGPNVSGLTGSPDALKALAGAYGVHSQPVTPGDPHAGLMHTSAVFGIDRQGRLRVLLHPDEPGSGLSEDLRALLRS